MPRILQPSLHAYLLASHRLRGYIIVSDVECKGQGSGNFCREKQSTGKGLQVKLRVLLSVRKEGPRALWVEWRVQSAKVCPEEEMRRNRKNMVNMRQKSYR